MTRVVNLAAVGSIATSTGKTAYPGAVLQVVQTQKTSVFSTASTSYVDVTGLSVSITPSSATSKILVSFTINTGANSSGWYGSQMNLVRDSTNIALGDVSGSDSRGTIDFSQPSGTSMLVMPVAMQWLDSPATTSAVTYKIQIRSIQATTLYINQSAYRNGTAVYNLQTPSSITVMEIAA